jgi:hypothetical protein
MSQAVWLPKRAHFYLPSLTICSLLTNKPGLRLLLANSSALVSTM